MQIKKTKKNPNKILFFFSSISRAKEYFCCAFSKLIDKIDHVQSTNDI